MRVGSQEMEENKSAFFFPSADHRLLRSPEKRTPDRRLKFHCQNLSDVVNRSYRLQFNVDQNPTHLQ